MHTVFTVITYLSVIPFAVMVWAIIVLIRGNKTDRRMKRNQKEAARKIELQNQYNAIRMKQFRKTR